MTGGNLLCIKIVINILINQKQENTILIIFLRTLFVIQPSAVISLNVRRYISMPSSRVCPNIMPGGDFVMGFVNVYHKGLFYTRAPGVHVCNDVFDCESDRCTCMIIIQGMKKMCRVPYCYIVTRGGKMPELKLHSATTLNCYRLTFL